MRVEGRVTEEGLPVDGATVELFVPGRVLGARTARDGRFAFDGVPRPALPLAGHLVTATKGKLVATGRATWDEKRESSPKLELGLVPGVPVEGRVTGPKGAPLADVEIRGFVDPPFEQLARVAGRTLSGPDGRYRLHLAAGRAILHARGEGVVPQQEALELPADGATLEFKLEADAPIGGIVVDEAGKPLAGAKVTARRQGQLLDDRMALSGPDGRFRLGGLSPGEVELVATHAEMKPGHVTVTAPSSGARLALARGGEARGVVKHGDGRPIEARLRTLRHGLPPDVRADVSHETRSGPDGRFRLSGLDDGRWVIEASPIDPAAGAPVHAVVTLEQGRAPEVEILFPRTGAIDGVVVDEHGQPLARVHVRASPADAPGQPPGPAGRVPIEATTDARGRFVLLGVEGGAYRVSAERIGFVSPGGKRDRFGEEGPLATAGASDFRVSLRRTGVVTGRVLGPDGKVPAGFVLSGMDVEVDEAAGRFWAALEGKGPFTLRLRAPGLAGRVWRYEKAPAADVELGEVRLAAAKALAGKVLDPGGAPRPGVMVEAHLGDWRDQALSDGSGGFSFEAPEGTAELSAEEQDGLAAVLVPTGREPVELRLAAPASVGGLVIDGAGKPFTGATVEARGARTLTVGAARGYFSFPRLAPGRWVLRVLRGGSKEAERDFEPVAVDLRAGAREMIELRAR